MINVNKIQRKLILIGLFFVPFLSIGEVLALFAGELVSQSENLTGLFKITKDVIFILIIILGLIKLSFYKSTLSISRIIFLVVLSYLFLSSFVNSIDNDPLSLISGIRWYIPLFIGFAFYSCVNDIFINQISKSLYILILFNLILQIFQLFFASSWYGTNFLGLNLRNPGIFLIPSTTAIFITISTYYLLFLSNRQSHSGYFVLLLSSISIILTASGTGFMIFGILILFYLHQEKALIKNLPYVIFFGSILIGFSLNLLLDRGDDYIEISGGTRLLIIGNALKESTFISNNFGIGTNTYVMLNEAAILDSTFASILINLGYQGVVLFYLALIYFIMTAIAKRNSRMLLILLIGLITSFFTIINELYPFNLLWPLALVYLVKKKKLN